MLERVSGRPAFGPLRCDPPVGPRRAPKAADPEIVPQHSHRTCAPKACRYPLGAKMRDTALGPCSATRRWAAPAHRFTARARHLKPSGLAWTDGVLAAAFCQLPAAVSAEPHGVRSGACMSTRRSRSNAGRYGRRTQRDRAPAPAVPRSPRALRIAMQLVRLQRPLAPLLPRLSPTSHSRACQLHWSAQAFVHRRGGLQRRWQSSAA